MSFAFQNIDPTPPSPPGECVPPAFVVDGFVAVLFSLKRCVVLQMNDAAVIV